MLWKPSEESKKRWERFRKTRRAWWSLCLLTIAYVLSLTSPWLVDDKPLALRWNGEWTFPAFAFYPDSHFGGSYGTEPDYVKLLASSRSVTAQAFAIMPPIAQSPIRSHLEADGAPPYAPSAKHWLGTDAHGRDVLSRLIHGFRIGMTFSLLLAVLGTVLGIIVGGVQGFVGGKVDMLAQRAIEVWSSLPFLYVVILIGSLYGQGFWLLVAIMALFQWIGLSYYMRAEFLRLRQVQYVKAARVLGMGRVHIFFREMLPNAMTPVVTIFPFSLIGGISSLTSLDFLGFGLRPPTPSWGDLLSQGLNNLYAPWIAISTVLALFVTLLLSTFVGEGVRDAMDPKTGDRYE